MKHLKLIGLAVVAAMAVIGFAGAGSASATVLCKATETPCSEANLIKKGAEFSADTEGRTLIEETSGLIIESCTGGSLATTISGQGGATETVIISTTTSSWTWSGCEAGGLSATESGQLELQHLTGTDHATMTGKGFGIKLTKSGCTYVSASGNEVGRVTGGTSPVIDVHTVLTKSKGELTCPPDIVWIATYKITKPSVFYVVAS
jgi:hypothetical protein